MMVGDGLNDLDALEVVGHSVQWATLIRIFLITAIVVAPVGAGWFG